MRPTLILFDVDGTLIDARGAGRRAMERGFREVFRLDEIGKSAASVSFAGMTDPHIFRDLAQALGIEPDRFAREREHLEQAYLKALETELAKPEGGGRLMPGVKPLLDVLESEPGVYLGLLTGNLERGARTKLEPFGLNGYFSGGGFGSDHDDRREIARLARLELSRLTGVGFTDRAVVVIGDTALDVDCARANGFTSVAVASGWGSRESLELAGPDTLLPDLTDLPRSLEALGLSSSAPGRRYPRGVY